MRTSCPHFGSFCIVSSFITFRQNFTSGRIQVILPRLRIGMLSLVTVSPVITAFHSCCLSHHVFDQANLWPAWVGFETMLTWSRRDSTPLSAAPRAPKGDQGWFFCLINPIICSPYLIFHSRVRTEFVIVFNWNHFAMRLLNLRINFFFIYCGLFVLILVVFVLFTVNVDYMKLFSLQMGMKNCFFFIQSTLSVLLL